MSCRRNRTLDFRLPPPQ